MLFVFLSFLHPPRQRIALLRSAKLILVLTEFIMWEYDTFRFSLKFSASFWTIFVEPGGKICGTQLLCSRLRVLCWYLNVLTLMIFVCVRYSFRAGFSMGLKIITLKKVRLNRPPQSPFTLMSSRASPSIVVVCCERFRLPTIKVSANLNIMAYFVQECRKGIENFIMY